MPPRMRLFNFGFLSLNLLVLFAFCNLAVFFSFVSFLDQLPIEPRWHGVLIGLLSASALVVRPIISPWLTPYNATRAVAAGLTLTAMSLLLYSQVHSLVPMILLRVLHGAANVTMLSASVTLLVAFMPPKKSGQGFGIITIMTLLPYAVIPLILENSVGHVPLGDVYMYTALLMLPPALLLIPIARRVRAMGSTQQGTGNRQPEGGLRLNLAQPKVLLLLGSNGLLFSVFSIVFFFIKTFCSQSGIGNPGLFFTVSTCVMIGVRICFGSLFDRYDKAVLGMASLLVLTLAILLLNAMQSPALFYAAATLYGVGVGAATPLMNGLMFTISQPQYRSLNTNLMLEMVDAGFFLGPAACGLALAADLDQTTILWACAGIILMAAGLLYPLKNTYAE